ncbi:MAG: hypothetical protein KGJ66_03090 [Alphaproteobacteria bacterium]|nr:hypothetical protein [Alphaproteobacteria bacterium]
MTERNWPLALAVFAFIAFAAPARAETVTLVCRNPRNPQPLIVTVDFAKHTACITVPGATGCPLSGFAPEPATITDRTITLDADLRIDRITGTLADADGAIGTCKPATPSS